ncbi:MAG: GNAT family N-acetyltransferase [Candidatus Omnitrophota bacterium]
MADRVESGCSISAIRQWYINLFLEVKKRARIDGVWSAVAYVVRGICFRAVWCNAFFVLTKDIDKISFPDTGLNGNIEVLERFDKGKLDRYFGPLTLKKFKDRFNIGNVCFLYRKDGIIGHYSWLRRQGARFVAVADDEIYLFNSYTFPRFRKQKIHTAVVYKRLRYIKDMGCKRAVVGVNTFNRKALKVLMANFSFNMREFILYVKILGKEFVISKDYFLNKFSLKDGAIVSRSGNAS